MITLDAFDELYYAHVDSLLNYASKLTKDNQLIEDAIQDVFASLWKSRKKLIIHKTIRGYLLVSVRHQVVHLLKNRGTVDDSTLNILSETSIKENGTTQLQSKHVLDNIDRLSSREREAILLKYYENLDYEEISLVMGLKKHAIYKLVSRGIGKLKNELNK